MKKRPFILLAVLALVLLLTLFAGPVYAASPYGVTVNGVDFDDSNIDTGIQCGSGKATLDSIAIPARLTLEDVTISGTDCGIYSEVPLDVVVKGTNSISSESDGIWSTEKMCIQVYGSLKVTSDNSGIFVNKDGLDIHVFENASMDLSGKYYAVSVSEGGLHLDNEGTAKLSGDYVGIIVMGGESVSIYGDGDLTIDSAGTGIDAFDGTFVTISGCGNKTINADYRGICAYGDVIVNTKIDGAITVNQTGTKSLSAAVYSREGNVECKGSGTIVFNATGDYGVMLEGVTSKLLLNGTHESVTISGSSEAFCNGDAQIVAGTKRGRYIPEGSPDKPKLIYRIENNPWKLLQAIIDLEQPASETDEMSWHSSGGTIDISLKTDITCDSPTDLGPINVPGGRTVVLNLNGHTLDRGLSAASPTRKGTGNLFTVSGELIIKDSGNGKLTGASDQYGCVYVTSTGSLNMNGGTITGNKGGSGNGLADPGSAGVYCLGYAYIEKSQIIKNESTTYGGGISVTGNGTVYLNKAIVEENSAQSSGGGLFANFGGTITAFGGSVSKNSAQQDGGGIAAYYSGTKVTLNGTEVEGNTARVEGGGILLYQAELVMTGGTVKDNTAWATGGIQNNSGKVYLTAESGQEIVITGNKADESTGGVKGGPEVHVSGKVIIQDNIYSAQYRGDDGMIPEEADLKASAPVIVEGDLAGSSIVLSLSDSGVRYHKTGVLTSGYTAKNPGAGLDDFFKYDGPFAVGINADGEIEIGPVFKVTFETNGGSTVDPVKVMEGVKVEQPTDPTKTGHVFTGWYTDSACTAAYDFDTPVTAALTLYAGWECPITSITVDTDSVTLAVGGSRTVTATVDPAETTETVLWESADETVATVDAGGKITAVAPGAVKITVKSPDGKVSASVTVTVVSGDIPITKIAPDPETLNLKVGDTATVKAAVEPANTTETVTWTSGDESVATVDAGGKITAVAPGAVKITVKSPDGKVSASVTVTIDPIVYRLIRGDNQSIPRNAPDATFASEADYSKFVSVEVDGAKLSSDDYDSYSGSTVIVLKGAFIQKLALGTHSIKIISKDGYALGEFIVRKIPETGDSGMPGLWTACLGIALIGIVTLRRKRKHV